MRAARCAVLAPPRRLARRSHDGTHSSLGSLAPELLPPPPGAVAALAAAVRGGAGAGSSLLVLTGAGVSTAAGIPDYRSPGRPVYKPIQAHEFATSAGTRQRWWARSYTGYERFSAARPAPAHAALARLQAALARAGGRVSLITQNVDRLHQSAGSDAVLELHGTVHEVVCAGCGLLTPRADEQARLHALNPGWLAAARAATPAGAARPDGDVELSREHVASLVLAPCGRCGSLHRGPAVVWFGGSVPPAVTDASFRAADAAGAALVLGTTLSTFSALRVVKRVADRGRPVAIVNLGPTRGDALPGAVKVAASLEPTLHALLEELLPPAGAAGAAGAAR